MLKNPHRWKFGCSKILDFAIGRNLNMKGVLQDGCPPVISPFFGAHRAVLQPLVSVRIPEGTRTMERIGTKVAAGTPTQL